MICPTYIAVRLRAGTADTPHHPPSDAIGCCRGYLHCRVSRPFKPSYRPRMHIWVRYLVQKGKKPRCTVQLRPEVGK